ncbi:hypothetical protein IW261DRAFT_120696 [Armillaria novae-zelandiae]|uniref:DUF3295 domain-containing protein n=1 Tax=Armillaria novae-zelandiae TaxID=153914 RepID=A0AA39PAT5_9AGAR|nr:hypothetical protein IW261DRAFT_120696 [Armillaria novae-zelandiae]
MCIGKLIEDIGMSQPITRCKIETSQGRTRSNKQGPDGNMLRSSLPTPSADTVIISIIPACDAPQAEGSVAPASPASRRPAISSLQTSSPCATSFPRVVVVNPTPNPTPHPTPPATPVLPSTISNMPLPNSLPQASAPSSSKPPVSSRPSPASSTSRQAQSMSLCPPAPTPSAVSLNPSERRFYVATGSPSSASGTSDSPPASGLGSSSSPSASATSELPAGSVLRPRSLSSDGRSSSESSGSHTDFSDEPEPGDVQSRSSSGVRRRVQPKKNSKFFMHGGRHHGIGHWPNGRISSLSQSKEKERMDREERERLARDKAELETQRRLRSEQEERMRLQARERERETERRRQEEEAKEMQREKEAGRELERMKARELAKERERVKQVERERELRRRASMETLPRQPPVDTEIFDFNEDASSDPFLQASGSQPDLTRTYFGLSRALSPPKPNTSKGKGKDHGQRHLTKSGTDLQVLVKEKATARMQMQRLKGAFTPLRNSPSTSFKEHNGVQRPSRKSSRETLSQAPVKKQSPPKPPSVKGKEKANSQQQTGGGRPIVIVDESDDETDSGEDGWTSCDDDSAEVEVVTVSNFFRDPSIPQRLSQSERERVSPRRNVQPTQNTRPPPSNTTTKPRNSRRQQPPPPDPAKLQDAMLEAARQRDMFVKVPKGSYTNLNRTNSGLLSLLMNPDPARLPHNQYRRVESSTELGSGSRQTGKDTGLQPSHSAVALPVSAQITVGSVRDKGEVKTNPLGADRTSPPGNSGYRRKGRPEDEEMEDDSDGEDGNTLMVSNSVAEERLRAIFGSSRGGAALPGVKEHRSEPSIRPPASSPPIPTPAKDLPTVTEHAPLGFPYNLPVAAMPSTPRTTRQNMLRTEMSESVRQNLLWSRYIHKQSVLGPRRKSSPSLPDREPIATIAPVVHLTKRVDGRRSGGADAEREAVRRELQRVNLTRNKSWC